VSSKRLRYSHLALGCSIVLLVAVVGLFGEWGASGVTLGARSLQLSDSRPSAQADYIVAFTGQTAGSVGSVRVQFCVNDPLIGTPCTAPAGFDVSAAVLSSQSGMGGFSIDAGNTTTNVLVLTRPPAPSVPGNSTYTLTGVTNPSAEASYYVRLETFASIDATGANTDHGGMAFAIGSPVTVSTVVPPYMLFCAASNMPDLSCGTASGNSIDFGDFSTTSTRTGQTRLLIATNAEFGYNISVIGTTLTSGNNVIPAVTGGDFSRIGTSQFGLNLAANTTPPTGAGPQGPGAGTPAPGYGAANVYRFNSGEAIATGTGVEDLHRFTVSYVVNISQSQPPGVYVSTLTYVSLANF
jgi:hypothetical protein